MVTEDERELKKKAVIAALSFLRDAGIDARLHYLYRSSSEVIMDLPGVMADWFANGNNFYSESKQVNRK